MRKLLIGGAALLAMTGMAFAQPMPGHQPPPPGPHHGWMMHRMMHRMGPMIVPGPSAFFRFKHGHSEIDIKCANDEPTQVCVGAAIALMNHVASMPEPHEHDHGQGNGGQSGGQSGGGQSGH